MHKYGGELVDIIQGLFYAGCILIGIKVASMLAKVRRSFFEDNDDEI